MPIDPLRWKRSILDAHMIDYRSLVGFRDSTLPNGMRIIDVYSASGLNFTILPDRGMDIWSASYKGIPLTWLSPGSPYPPDWGQSWLRQFNGGLLTTCGLSHVGPPEVDEITGERRDIHGTYTRLRASIISAPEADWYTEEGAKYNRMELRINATLWDAPIFGSQLKIKRTIIASLHQPDIGIMDHITNVGDQAVPLMLLYHINLGFPLIQDGSTLYTRSHRVVPRDAAAQAGLATWQTYDAPAPNYAEQVFYHHLLASPPFTEERGTMSQVMLTTPTEDLALELIWDHHSLPYFTQWKNTRQGQYVCGIEPGNCIPEGQNAARRNGRLQFIQPGEHVETYVGLSVRDGKRAVKRYKDWFATPLPEAIPHPFVKLGQDPNP